MSVKHICAWHVISTSVKPNVQRHPRLVRLAFVCLRGACTHRHAIRRHQHRNELPPLPQRRSNDNKQHATSPRLRRFYGAYFISRTEKTWQPGRQAAGANVDISVVFPHTDIKNVLCWQVICLPGPLWVYCAFRATYRRNVTLTPHVSAATCHLICLEVVNSVAAAAAAPTWSVPENIGAHWEGNDGFNAGVRVSEDDVNSSRCFYCQMHRTTQFGRTRHGNSCDKSPATTHLGQNIQERWNNIQAIIKKAMVIEMVEMVIQY